MSATQIRQRLDRILEFMQPHWDLVNCHMVSYLVDGHWDRYVPTEVRSELPNIQAIEKCTEKIFWQNVDARASDSFPFVLNFLKSCEEQRLEQFTEILANKDQFMQVMEGKKISVKEFMSEKKRHEVETTADVVDGLMRAWISNGNSAKNLFVIDAGDGKGYLSSRLALQYSYNVLGIDCNATNTKNALERNRKLTRVWDGLLERATIQSQGLTPPRRGGKNLKSKKSTNDDKKNKSENYMTTTQFVNSNLDVVKLVEDFFPSLETSSQSEELPEICLTGLHTCGNLATTCLRLFHTQAQCKILCNIGCCYHLLKEAYTSNERFGSNIFKSTEGDSGFPMSQFLSKKHVTLGRGARMLAAQSVDRVFAAKKEANISLFYRALLEVLVCEKFPHLKDMMNVGKIQKFENFREYVELCLKKKGISTTNLKLDEVEKIEARFADDKFYMEFFYLLRMAFAPIIETIILLDRLLYLRELGYNHSYLVSIFDAILSPRHYAIIAVKR